MHKLVKVPKKPIFIAALEVQKAFDVVNHDFLLHKLYFDGVGGGDEWLLLKDLYTDMTTRVKWDGFLSSSFVIRQGVRLGGILSASHYNNSFLIDVEDKFTGKSIGTIKTPHVTCADDMCYIIEIRDEFQCMISTPETYANREHYSIHPTKSAVAVDNSLDSPSIILYGKEIPIEDQTIHLVVQRHQKCIPNTDEKVNLGRRTAYSLMGAGFHGKPGIKQSLKADMWRKYVVPRLTWRY